jgi:hypothetical protein
MKNLESEIFFKNLGSLEIFKFLEILTYLLFFNGCKKFRVDRRHPYEVGIKKNCTKEALGQGKSEWSKEISRKEIYY